MRPDETETVTMLGYLLHKGEPFVHTRFGDGDVFFATGTGPRITADGEEWSRGLQWQLLNAWERIVITRHRLLVGDVNSYINDDGCGHQWDVMREYASYRRGEPLELVHIEALRCGLGYSAPLYKTIADDPRRKFYIAPHRLAAAAEMLGAEHIKIPLHIAFLDEHFWDAHQRIHKEARRYDQDVIVLLSAGRAGHIMQGQICHDGSPWTQIDIGSGLDLLFTDLRRSTDHGINIEEIRDEFRSAGLHV